MARFLIHSKTLLPTSINRSTDAFRILQKGPSFSTAQTEELLKQEPKKPETPKDPFKQESPKIEPLNKAVIQNTTPQNNFKMMIRKSPDLAAPAVGDSIKIPGDSDFPASVTMKKSGQPVVDSCKITRDSEIPTSVMEKGSQLLKVFTIESSNQKTLLRALFLDLIQLQRGVGFLLAEARVRLSQQVLKGQMERSDSGAVRVEQSKLKEREPVPVLSVVQKKTEESKESDSPFLKSNLWEAVQENSPAWQSSISIGLGNLQKTVVEKLAK